LRPFPLGSVATLAPAPYSNLEGQVQTAPDWAIPTFAIASCMTIRDSRDDVSGGTESEH